MIALPMSFFSDSEDMPSDHPEYKAVSACQPVEACGIGIVGFTRVRRCHGSSTFLQRGERDRIGTLSLEITPNPEQCFEALRES